MVWELKILRTLEEGSVFESSKEKKSTKSIQSELPLAIAGKKLPRERRIKRS
jgi:hypothetical protein